MSYSSNDLLKQCLLHRQENGKDKLIKNSEQMPPRTWYERTWLSDNTQQKIVVIDLKRKGHTEMEKWASWKGNTNTKQNIQIRHQGNKF